MGGDARPGSPGRCWACRARRRASPARRRRAILRGEDVPHVWNILPACQPRAKPSPSRRPPGGFGLAGAGGSGPPRYGVFCETAAQFAFRRGDPLSPVAAGEQGVFPGGRRDFRPRDGILGTPDRTHGLPSWSRLQLQLLVKKPLTTKPRRRSARRHAACFESPTPNKVPANVAGEGRPARRPRLYRPSPSPPTVLNAPGPPSRGRFSLRGFHLPAEGPTFSSTPSSLPLHEPFATGCAPTSCASRRARVGLVRVLSSPSVPLTSCRPARGLLSSAP
jgi:hypothetical protein